MKNVSIEKLIPYAAAIVIFLVISLLYFAPDLFQGKVMYQNDTEMGAAIGNEIGKYHEETGKRTLWTNTAFGGMPTYQISPDYPSLKVITQIQKLTWLYLPAPASYVFILLIGGFLLFLALRINPWLAVIGAIAYAFSSYFFVIIHAGHIWKVWVMAYIPATFAGIIWLYRGKYLLGAFVTALYTSLQLMSNHPQMSYYFAMVVLIYVIAEFIYSLKNKLLKRFAIASCLLIVSAGIGLAINSTSLYHSYDYSKYTIRGPSELSSNAENKTAGGIDRDYATQWSYGIGETFTLLIPDAKGGVSQGLGTNPDELKAASPDMRSNVANMSRYWGNQPWTQGTVYVGAFIVFLFVLGLFIVEHRIKWVMLIATILSIMLAWGHNLMWFTDLFFDYFPLYDKFRTVASILVIAELCIPILALMALQKILTDPQVLKEKAKAVYISLGATAGLLVLFLIAPKFFFDFISDVENAQFAELLRNPQQGALYSRFLQEIEAVRVSIFRADTFRSLVIILIGVAFLFLYQRKLINKTLFIALVTVLVLFDLWQVDKRFLGSKDFSPKKATVESRMQKTPVDDEILKDKSLSYRVYNLSVPTFQDGQTSLYHKSLGGYHAAKLRRYQDIIEGYLSKIGASNVEAAMHTPYFNVPNMLNAKYIIGLNPDNSQKLIRNPGALGNAWFVNNVMWANNADEEFAALEGLDPKNVAVVDKRFEKQLAGYTPEKYITPVDEENISANDSYVNDPSSITLTSYAPNEMVYKSNALTPKVAIFSEIYYPGWQVYIDGEKVDHFRANYILRGLFIPQGEHTIEFRFDPPSEHMTERMATIGYILIFLLLIGAIAYPFVAKKKETAE